MKFFLIYLVVFFSQLNLCIANDLDFSKLNLEKTVYVGLKNNYDLNIQKIELSNKNLEVIKQKSIYEPILNAKYSYNDDYTLLSNLSTTEYSVDLSTRTPLGTKLTVAQEHISYDYRSTTDDSYINQVYLRVDQPLLRGFGSDINSKDINIQKLETKLQKIKIKNTYLKEIYEIVDLFWQLAKSKQTTIVRDKSYKLSKDLYSKKELEASLGGFAKANLLELEGDTYEKNVVLIQAQRDENLKKIALTNKLQLFDMNAYDVGIEYKFHMDKYEINYEQLLDLALKTDFNYNDLLTKVKKNKIEQNFTENSTLPTLDFYVKYGKKEQDNGNGNSLEFDYDGDESKIGLDFSMPIFRSKAKSSLEQNKVINNKLMLQKNKAKQDIQKALKLSIENYKNDKNLIAIQKRRFDQQIKLMDVEKKKLESSLIKITDYLVKQDKYINAQLDYKLSYIRYKQSQSDLYSLIGKLPNFINYEEESY